MIRFLRADFDGFGPRVGQIVDMSTVWVLDHDEPLRAIAGEGETVETVSLAGLELLPPIEAPEIWCAGVTYERSRDARLEEAETDARDVYSLVYDADRPELFMKDAAMRRTVGPGGAIGLRKDARWTVPEPELGVVLGEGGAPVAVTVGNDVSSRDIEGANPLYIPQAKIFAGACAIGPCLAVPEDWDAPFGIRMNIHAWEPDRGGLDNGLLFSGETSTAKMKRKPRELVEWLLRDNPVPPGSVLLTGTGIVPPDDYTLEPGHSVWIEIDGIGWLTNTVAAATVDHPLNDDER